MQVMSRMQFGSQAGLIVALKKALHQSQTPSASCVPPEGGRHQRYFNPEKTSENLLQLAEPDMFKAGCA